MAHAVVTTHRSAQSNAEKAVTEGWFQQNILVDIHASDSLLHINNSIFTLVMKLVNIG